MPLRLPRLQATSPITDKESRPAQSFQVWFQRFAEAIESAFNGLADLVQQIAELTGVADQLAQALADAQQATVDAQAAADTAQAAADAANAQAAQAAKDQALAASYIDPDSVLSASPTVITIAAHTRIYGDGTTAPVSGGSVPATSPADDDYVFYLDPTRAGGVVTYQVTTTPPSQLGDTHVVGAVTIPGGGTASGGAGPRPPGYVIP